MSDQVVRTFRNPRGAVVDITLDLPEMGGKIWVLDDKGIFVLERGPGAIRTIACTHAGSGSVTAYDGIPDDRGFFPDTGLFDITDPGFATMNGRPIYRANPVVMGSWMMDGGFHHGLTIIASGGHSSVNLTASIVWMPAPKRKVKPA